MIVRDTWKPRPKRNFQYQDIHSGYVEHCRYGAYLNFLKDLGGIYSYKYIFYDERFLIKYKGRDYYLIPQFIVFYTENSFEYQTYVFGLTSWYQKMWKLFEKQRPYVEKHTRVISEFEYQYVLYKLWDKEERKKRFNSIRYEER